MSWIGLPPFSAPVRTARMGIRRPRSIFQSKNFAQSHEGRSCEKHYRSVVGFICRFGSLNSRHRRHGVDYAGRSPTSDLEGCLCFPGHHARPTYRPFRLRCRRTPFPASTAAQVSRLRRCNDRSEFAPRDLPEDAERRPHAKGETLRQADGNRDSGRGGSAGRSFGPRGNPRLGRTTHVDDLRDQRRTLESPKWPRPVSIAEAKKTRERSSVRNAAETQPSPHRWPPNIRHCRKSATDCAPTSPRRRQGWRRTDASRTVPEPFIP